MKVEKRQYSCFISHSGLTVFVNKTYTGYSINVTTKNPDNTYSKAGEMKVSLDDLKKFYNFIGELIK